MEDALKHCLDGLSEEARELYLPPGITVLDSPPSPLVFYREYVSKNIPVIVKNALTTWEAFSKWTVDYLDKSLGTLQVSVTATPNGYADAPLGDRFLLPEERLMPFHKFLKIWDRKELSNGVFYIQKQNSNFTDEFSQLISDADSHIEWASEAFGTKPDAVNFWMGNSDSITSMHKDHYENLYAVVKGQKTFILHPPTDIPHIPYETYRLARYKENSDGIFDIIDIYEDNNSGCIDTSEENNSRNVDIYEENSNGNMDSSEENSFGCVDIYKENGIGHMDSSDVIESEVIEAVEGTNQPQNALDSGERPNSELISWIAIDPLNPDLERYPQYEKCRKYIVKVNPGDILYLPSLWFHHVTQSDQTIAVNFWYDMEYDIKYNYFKFAESISKAVF